MEDLNTPQGAQDGAPAVTPPAEGQPAPQAPSVQTGAAAEPKPLDNLSPPVDSKKEINVQSQPVGEVIVYEPTGNPNLDLALDFVGKLGISGDHPAMQAAANGDFGLIKATLATAGPAAQGWEAVVALAETAYAQVQEREQAAITAVRDAVHQVAGGEEAWLSVLEWARSEATEDEKSAINAMLDAGPVSARIAAQALVQEYGKAKGTVVAPRKALSESASPAATSKGPMSPTEYYEAVKELRARYGTQLDTQQEYIDLRRRYTQTR